LETNGPEFRVGYHSAIDNLEWDDKNMESTKDEDVKIANARRMFSGCKVFTNRKEARSFAKEEKKNWPYLEYGIQSIVIRRKF